MSTVFAQADVAINDLMTAGGSSQSTAPSIVRKTGTLQWRTISVS